MKTMKKTKTTSPSTTSSDSKSTLHAFVRSATGYKKVLRGKPCEDAAKAIRLKKAVICAVADGHGDSKCKYADIGSALAAEVACDALKTVYQEHERANDLYEYVSDNRETILKKIICKWNEKVVLDYFEKQNGEAQGVGGSDLAEYARKAFDPLGENLSVDELRRRYEERDRNSHALRRITLLYGTTLNAVLITEKLIVCMGIGGGDVVAVQGKRIDWLLPTSEQFSTATESLCYKPEKALDAFRSIVVRRSKDNKKLSSSGIDPDFILLASDGLRNSFLSDDHFAEKIVGLNAEKKKRYRFFQRNSQRWIEQLTKDSLYQDDVTFGFVY